MSGMITAAVVTAVAASATAISADQQRKTAKKAIKKQERDQIAEADKVKAQGIEEDRRAEEIAVEKGRTKKRRAAQVGAAKKNVRSTRPGLGATTAGASSGAGAPAKTLLGS